MTKNNKEKVEVNTLKKSNYSFFEILLNESDFLLSIFNEAETSRMMNLLRSEPNDKSYKMGGDVVETIVRVFKNRDDERLIREILLQINQYLDQGNYKLFRF